MVPLAIMGLSIQELMVILLIVLLLFGAKKIPEIARGLGEGIRGFRSSLKGDESSSTPVEDKDAAEKGTRN